jgi:hypothetical protein
MKLILFFGIGTLLVQGMCTGVSQKRADTPQVILCMSETQKLYDIKFSQPKLTFPLSVNTAQPLAETMSIQVVNVINPGRLPVRLQVAFSDSLQQWPAGNFTLYPPDRPGIFTLRISNVMNDLLKKSRQSGTRLCYLHITLDTSEIKKHKKPVIDSLLIKICDPVYK